MWFNVVDHNPSNPDSIFCCETMERYNAIEEALLSSVIDEQTPKEVSTFIKVNKNKCRCGCWYSSFRSKNSDECNRKIKEWFDARTSVLNLGRSLAKDKWK